MSNYDSYAPIAYQAALRHGVNPDIFLRQIYQESRWNPKARSPVGALGIAQFMPGTAEEYGIDPLDPVQALDAGARYMAKSLKRYGGDYAKALASYNAGIGAVDKYKGVPPYEETRNYVSKILGGNKDGGSYTIEASELTGDPATYSGKPMPMSAAMNEQGYPPIPMPPMPQAPQQQAPGGLLDINPNTGLAPIQLLGAALLSNTRGGRNAMGGLLPFFQAMGGGGRASGFTPMDQWRIAKDRYEMQRQQRLDAQPDADRYGLTPIWAEDDQGNLVPYQTSTGGGIHRMETPDGVKFVEPVRYLDTGGEYTGRGTRTGRAVGEPVEKGLEPSQELEYREKAAATEAEQKRLSELKSTYPKVNQARLALKERTGFIVKQTKKAKDLVGALTTGYGSLLKNVPMTESRKLGNILDTIANNIAFGELQQMRDFSPTGGAVGQLTDLEREAIGALKGKLDQGMKGEDLVEVLDQIEELTNRMQSNADTAFREQYFDAKTDYGEEGNDPLSIR